MNTPNMSEIKARINYLRELKDDWYSQGEGTAYNSEHLNWLEEVFEEYYHSEIPLAISPWFDDVVVLEWNIKRNCATFEIDLEAKTGYWHNLNCDTREDSEADLKVDDKESWEYITKELTRFSVE